MSLSGMTQLRLATLAAFTQCAVSFAIHAAPPSPVIALRVESAPQLDGTLDDPVWKEATWQEGFTEPETGRPAETPTRFAVVFDDQSLYVAFRCVEPSLDKLEANVTTRDAPELDHDDVVELFVAPGPQRTDYYQFDVNSKGTVADAAGRQSGTVRDVAWNAPVHVATSQGDGEWVVEMAVPLADMELGKSAPGDWGINVTRIRRAERPLTVLFIVSHDDESPGSARGDVERRGDRLRFHRLVSNRHPRVHDRHLATG